MLSTDAQLRLVDEGRKLLHIAYRNGHPARIFDVDLEAPPITLSCTQFIALVFQRTLGSAMALSFIDDAHSMWQDSKSSLTPVAAQDVQPGDLAFFTRDSMNPGDPRTGPEGTAQEWHVMMVSRSTSMVIGACPMLDEARELDAAQYVQQEDKGRCWILAGHRRPHGL